LFTRLQVTVITSVSFAVCSARWLSKCCLEWDTVSCCCVLNTQ